MKKWSVHFIIFISCVLASDSIFAQQGEWTWMKGGSAYNNSPMYGTQGVPDPDNKPPALYEPAEWTDQNGNFWLFGGLKNNYAGEMNALWKFDPAANEWTWMKGSNNPLQAGTYGTQGIPASSNTPGARAWGACTFADTSGYLWLYGGIGYDGNGNGAVLNDLWRYDISTNEWTWMAGSDSGTMYVNFGTKGISSPSNTPGARAESNASWVDDSNRLWMFGGILYHPVPGGYSTSGAGNDMWMWDQNIHEWTWVSGSQQLNHFGVYGIKGIADSLNVPPARGSYAKWKDSSCNFYFFGGLNIYNGSCFSDLWKYDWHTNVFTWISGPDTTGGTGMYGVQGIPDTNNIPSARFENRSFWKDQCAEFWMWGGAHEGATFALLNDLWKYNLSSNEWTWMSGSNVGNSTGSYGIQGVSAPTNEPPARMGQVGWMDNNYNLWLFGGAILGLGMAKNDLWRYVPDSANCSPNQNPFPGFYAADASLCEKFCTNFYDASTNNPVSWQWSFPGGDPASSTDQNPVNICYNNPGTFDVTLITTDANGVSDTVLISNFILVNQNPLAPAITQAGNTLTSSPATAYQWQLNAVNIPGATNQSYVITQSGLYTILVYNSYGCTSQASVNAYLVGVENVDGNFSFSIYPNPSNGPFTFEYSNSGGERIVSLKIKTLLGAEVFSSAEKFTAPSSKKIIDLSDLPAGIYFIEIMTGSFFCSKKIIISK